LPIRAKLYGPQGGFAARVAGVVRVEALADEAVVTRVTPALFTAVRMRSLSSDQDVVPRREAPLDVVELLLLVDKIRDPAVDGLPRSPSAPTLRGWSRRRRRRRSHRGAEAAESCSERASERARVQKPVRERVVVRYDDIAKQVHGRAGALLPVAGSSAGIVAIAEPRNSSSGSPSSGRATPAPNSRSRRRRRSVRDAVVVEQRVVDVDQEDDPSGALTAAARSSG
jgi:hypothetical protein